MTSTQPVEVTTRFVTTVDHLADAWAFVMDRIDQVGSDPTVHIKPIWVYGVGDMIDGLDGADVSRPSRQFEIVVEGMVEEAKQ